MPPLVCILFDSIIGTIISYGCKCKLYAVYLMYLYNMIISCDRMIGKRLAVYTSIAPKTRGFSTSILAFRSCLCPYMDNPSSTISFSPSKRDYKN